MFISKKIKIFFYFVTIYNDIVFLDINIRIRSKSIKSELELKIVVTCRQVSLFCHVHFFSYQMNFIILMSNIILLILSINKY